MKNSKPFSFRIEEASIEECISFLKLIPEFTAPHKPKEEYICRFEEGKFLLQKAVLSNNEIIGVKVGYELTESIFYSWLGAVLPDFRKNGVAKKLAQNQEHWARKNYFEKIRFKTLNRHKAMLLFALKNGFEVTDFEPREESSEHRIILEKCL